MNIRSSFKYAIACPTSMGIRITPLDRLSVHTSDTFLMQATSAETNVLNVASSLGMECLAMTKFVKDSPIASFIKSDLRKRNIAYEGVDEEQGGPWGYRHQFNIADSGFGLRAPRVWNDRAGEVGLTMKASEFDLDRIFVEEGIGILHMSGLVAALSKDTTKLCRELAQKAKENGTLVSFDLNYRATFWKNRETELREAFQEIASKADILIGNEEDFQLCLGFKGPETGGKDLEDKISGFKDMLAVVRKEYPNAKIYGTTLREVRSAGSHLWGAILWADGEYHVENPRPIDVMDRIGGGDGFSAGLLYGLIKGYEPDKCLQLAWASGVLAASDIKDYVTPADEKQLLDIYKGNARVLR